MANVVYLESPWVSWSLVIISPSLQLIAPAKEAPGPSTALYPTVLVAWAAALISPFPKAFEVATGNGQLCWPHPLSGSFLSQSVLNTARSKRDEVYGGIISPQILVTLGRNRKDRKNHSGPLHSITRLFIIRESFGQLVQMPIYCLLFSSVSKQFKQ